MTKEDIEHNHIKEIAEKYVQETWGTFLDLYSVDLVLAGIGVAKIISKEKDEQITELEKQSKTKKQQLIKVKEIVKELVEDLAVIDGEQTKELKAVKEAEQFLKERD